MGRKYAKEKKGKKKSKKQEQRDADAAAAAAAKEEKKDLDGEGKKVDDYRHCTGVLESRAMARDVKIGQFSLASYGRELIQDTSIELTLGRRYGLIGPNGSGKTEFLKCLANREVPIPEHIDLYLLTHEAEPTEKTALQMTVEYLNDAVAKLERQADEAMDAYGPEHDITQGIYNRLDDLEPSQFEPRAAKMLAGLGFKGKMAAKATKDMSGGWRMRVSLAQALLIKPSLLLLDEPTNHLDIETCVWLEQYIVKHFDRCLIVVSHSQDFLNGVCTNILNITPQKTLVSYSGNYDMFIKTKSENEVNQMKRYKKEQDDIKHIKSFIASCGTFSNLVRQAKSKQKILDKMYEKGLTEPVQTIKPLNFRFPACEQLAPPVLAFYDVSFAYSGLPEDYLYTHTNLSINLDSRISLVGPNGAGKSTLLKLMCGELEPSVGSVRKHLTCKIGRYHQHSAEELDMTKSPLDFIMAKFPEVIQDRERWRAQLGRYGVTGYMQTTPMGKLSDGQKSRVVFSILSMQNPHLLFFDEPTNHLDMECIDSLAVAINNYEGGVVLVSHDFRLISQVSKEIWLCDAGKVERYEGDIREYKKILMKQMENEV